MYNNATILSRDYFIKPHFKVLEGGERIRTMVVVKVAGEKKPIWAIDHDTILRVGKSILACINDDGTIRLGRNWDCSMTSIHKVRSFLCYYAGQRLTTPKDYLTTEEIRGKIESGDFIVDETLPSEEIVKKTRAPATLDDLLDGLDEV
jgi:hypothetical protein